MAGLASLGRLLGYDLSAATLAAGEALDLTLHWQATETTGQRLVVYVHLVDAAGQTVAQADGEPGAGALPTSSWLPGEYLADPHRLLAPANLPAGTYTIEIGLYDPATGQRLLWLDAAGQPNDQPLRLPTPVVVK